MVVYLHILRVQRSGYRAAASRAMVTIQSGRPLWSDIGWKARALDRRCRHVARGHQRPSSTAISHTIGVQSASEMANQFTTPRQVAGTSRSGR